MSGLHEFGPALSETDFARLAGYIEREVGIRMPGSKKGMLESRLQKRLRAYGFSSYSQYVDLVVSGTGDSPEKSEFIDLVTTHHTYFFREDSQFALLEQQVLPRLSEQGAGARRPFRFWSAGCSTGEECYGVAMVLSEYGRKAGAPYTFEILGTDISTRVLRQARQGVYEEETARGVPSELRSRYLLRSRDKNLSLVRAVPALRSRMRFEEKNLFDPQLSVGAPVDVAFCRNVIIYFEKERQKQVVGAIVRNIVPGGYLFVGLTETAEGLGLPLVAIGKSAYRVEGRT